MVLAKIPLGGQVGRGLGAGATSGRDGGRGPDGGRRGWGLHRAGREGATARGKEPGGLEGSAWVCGWPG